MRQKAGVKTNGLSLTKFSLFLIKGMGCKHGICRSPNFCACEVGWEGTNCEICVRLPGCVNGNCSNELECNCYDGWAGAYCDIRK